jgi:hypothetical protein
MKPPKGRLGPRAGPTRPCRSASTAPDRRSSFGAVIRCGRRRHVPPSDRARCARRRRRRMVNRPRLRLAVAQRPAAGRVRRPPRTRRPSGRRAPVPTPMMPALANWARARSPRSDDRWARSSRPRWRYGAGSDGWRDVVTCARSVLGLGYSNRGRQSPARRRLRTSAASGNRRPTRARPLAPSTPPSATNKSLPDACITRTCSGSSAARLRGDPSPFECDATAPSVP